jgi:hypothetical protein
VWKKDGGENELWRGKPLQTTLRPSYVSHVRWSYPYQWRCQSTPQAATDSCCYPGRETRELENSCLLIAPSGQPRDAGNTARRHNNLYFIMVREQKGNHCYKALVSEKRSVESNGKSKPPGQLKEGASRVLRLRNGADFRQAEALCNCDFVPSPSTRMSSFCWHLDREDALRVTSFGP